MLIKILEMLCRHPDGGKAGVLQMTVTFFCFLLYLISCFYYPKYFIDVFGQREGALNMYGVAPVLSRRSVHLPVFAELAKLLR